MATKTLNNKKRKNWSKVWSIYFLVILLIVLCIYLIPGASSYSTNKAILGSFMLNGIFFLFMVGYSVNKYAYSLETMHWFFCFFFFFFAAIIQYVNRIYCWGYLASDRMVLTNNYFLLLWGIVFFIGNYFGNKKENFKKTEIEISARFINLFLIISAIIASYMIAEAGLSNLFSRGTSGTLFADIESQSTSLLLSHGMRGILTMTAAFTVIKYKKDHKCFIQMVIALVLLFLSCPPTGMSRYAAATIYIGLLLLLFPQLKKNRLFMFVFIFSFIIIFPTMNVFRNISIEQFSMERIINIFKGFTNEYLTGNYDAYTMLMFIRDYVDTLGITWGNQLLGALLFFIPRSLWSAKPIGSGGTVLTNLNYSFTNVSAPLPAEGFINFGLVGTIIFAFAVGFIVARLDKKFWINGKEIKKVDTTFLGIMYPFLLSLFFFMCRGDLLSTYAYMFALVFVGFTMYQLCKIIR